MNTQTSSLWCRIREYALQWMVIFISFSFCASLVYAAISWPSAPTGETTGGKYSLKLVPSTAIMAFNSPTCPAGWSPADGSGGRPDLRGEFIRGLDGGRWVDSGRTLASTQGDAIRNLSGTILTQSANGAPTWVFYIAGNTDGGFNWAWPASDTIGFDASRIVPTANENRPRNVAFLYCIKD